MLIIFLYRGPEGAAMSSEYFAGRNGRNKGLGGFAVGMNDGLQSLSNLATPNSVSQ